MNEALKEKILTSVRYSFQRSGITVNPFAITKAKVQIDIEEGREVFYLMSYEAYVLAQVQEAVNKLITFLNDYSGRINISVEPRCEGSKINCITIEIQGTAK